VLPSMPNLKVLNGTGSRTGANVILGSSSPRALSTPGAELITIGINGEKVAAINQGPLRFAVERTRAQAGSYAF